MLHEFVRAFRRRDLAGLTALLTDDATAEVVGSGFPVERGPADIEAKSLTHMLGTPQSQPDIEVFDHGGTPRLLFLSGSPPRLDTVADVVLDPGSGRIARIEYHVVWFRADELARTASARGIEPVTPGDDDAG